MIGTTLQDVTGRSYRVVRKLGEGGQGAAYEVEDERTHVRVVAKIYDPTVATPVAVARLDALCRYQLSTKSPAFCAPVSRLMDRYGVGAIQPLAKGEALSTLFENATFTLQEGLMIATALTRALSLLEQMGVGHGDLSPHNIFVFWNGKYYEVFLLDFDNAVMPGIPKPTFLGQEPYLAPEVLVTDRSPTLQSDRFSLGVVLHLLLFLRHPFAAVPEANTDIASYIAFLKTATWVEDPMAARVVTQTTGRPVRVLSRDLQALFRLALEVDPERRPESERWTQLLASALYNLFACDACGQTFVNEKTRTCCPCCGTPAPNYALHVNGRHLSLAATFTTIGRDDIGDNPKISREHVLFERQGLVLVAKCLSTNGIAVQTDKGWVELTRGEEAPVSPGTWLRIARGVEGLVCEAPR